MQREKKIVAPITATHSAETFIVLWNVLGTWKLADQIMLQEVTEVPFQVFPFKIQWWVDVGNKLA